MKRGVLLAFLTALSFMAYAQGTETRPHTQIPCESRPELQHQTRDAATVQRLENAWSRAFLTGDVAFLRCLLVPEFTEIVRSGEVKYLAYEIDVALANRGNSLPAADFPPESIVLRDDVAVAYGETIPVGGEHKRRTKFADFYVWKDGRWRAFFAQQTAVPDSSPPANTNGK